MNLVNKKLTLDLSDEKKFREVLFNELIEIKANLTVLKSVLIVIGANIVELNPEDDSIEKLVKQSLKNNDCNLSESISDDSVYQTLKKDFELSLAASRDEVVSSMIKKYNLRIVDENELNSGTKPE